MLSWIFPNTQIVQITDILTPDIIDMDDFTLPHDSVSDNHTKDFGILHRNPAVISLQGLDTFDFSFTVTCEAKEFALLPTFCALLGQKLASLQNSPISTSLETMMLLTREYLKLLGASTDLKM